MAMSTVAQGGKKRGQRGKRKETVQSRSRRAKRPKKAVPWHLLPEDALRIILFSVATDDPGGLVEDGDPMDPRPLVPRYFVHGPTSLADTLPTATDENGPRSMGLLRGLKILVTPWRRHFALVCRSFAKAARSLSHLSVRRWVGRSLCEGVMMKIGTDNSHEHLPDPYRIAKTLDAALRATEFVTSRALRRIVLRRETAEGALIDKPAFSDAWLLRYALGTPTNCIPYHFKTSEGFTRPPYSKCGPESLLALFVITLTHTPKALAIRGRGSSLIQTTATRMSTLDTKDKKAIAEGLMCYAVRVAPFGLLSRLSAPFAHRTSLVDPMLPLGYSHANDGRAPFSIEVALEAVKRGPIYFTELPSINRNDPRVWTHTCSRDPLMMTYVHTEAIAQSCINREVMKTVVDMTIKAVLHPPGGSKTMGVRFMCTLPMSLRKDVGFGKLLINSAPRCTISRAKLLMALPAACRRLTPVQQAAFGQGYERGYMDGNILVVREVPDHSRADQIRAGQSHANQSHANQIHANQSHANQSHANQSHAGM